MHALSTEIEHMYK